MSLVTRGALSGWIRAAIDYIASTSGLGNSGWGISIAASDNMIGGISTGAGNVIAFNGVDGVFVWGGSDGNSFFGNSIHHNAGSGIVIRGNDNRVGGAAAGAGNEIAFNGVDGVGVLDTATGNSILSNSIHDNGGSGILVSGLPTDNHIGMPGAGNLISGNCYAGLDLGGVKNFMQGNSIRANQGTGVLIDGGLGGHTIGGTEGGEGNEIAGNGGNGVLVTNGVSGVRILGNSIHDNCGRGIRLSGGGNNVQSFPVPYLFEPGSTTHVRGVLSSAPNQTYALDFYANAAADPSGYGEGERWLGTLSATTDFNGLVFFDRTLPGATATGHDRSASGLGQLMQRRREAAARRIAEESHVVPTGVEQSAGQFVERCRIAVQIALEVERLAGSEDCDAMVGNRSAKEHTVARSNAPRSQPASARGPDSVNRSGSAPL